MSDQALYTAIVALHAEVKTLPKDGWNSHSKYSYAKGDTVVREARAILAKHQLAWVRTGSRLKSPTLAEGILGNSKDYVGDVEISGLIIHASGSSLAVAGECPIVVMAALPHDKSWAASITFGTGYVLLGVLNQDKDDEDEINKREDSEQPTCTGENAHIAEANILLSEELAKMSGDATREQVWDWACKTAQVEAEDDGYPGPKELYLDEGGRVTKVLSAEIARRRKAAPS